MKISNISKRTLNEQLIPKKYFSISHVMKHAQKLRYKNKNIDRDGINCTGVGEVSMLDNGETVYDWVNIYKHNNIRQPSLSKICNYYGGRKY